MLPNLILCITPSPPVQTQPPPKHTHTHTHTHTLPFKNHALPAGTSLGDPVEVGAALGVLAEGGQRAPLQLIASKSWLGHAEPAAGLAGLLFAFHAAGHNATLQLMHLRSVNPYVCSSLDEAAHKVSAMLPKQPGGLPASHMQRLTYGVSAFAFQGTNAHALVHAAEEDAGRMSPASHADAKHAAWERRRHYVVPEASLLLSVASVGVMQGQGKQILLQGRLMTPQLAFLYDHQVMGKAIFPGIQK
jgi:acyl transferase domain-containing protein